ncbi:hypothetical protein BH23CHL4_BH23CHL4_11370 [soil metagenome]
MAGTRKTSGYAPGSNRGGSRSSNQSPVASLTDDQQVQIQQRFRQHDLAEDVRRGFDHDLFTPAAAQPGLIARLRASLSAMLAWRPPLKQARQHSCSQRKPWDPCPRRS